MGRQQSDIFTFCKYNRLPYSWDAVRIFDGPTVEKENDRFNYGESRVYAAGLVSGLEIAVVYTDENDEERRIISPWRAEPHERRSYWRNVEG